MGSSHTYGVSVLVNEAGDDSYRWPDYSAGSALCASIGIFADNDGSDHYLAAGAGGGFAWCTEEPVDAAGLFLDSGGDSDIYEGDWDDREPGDDASFGCHTDQCVYGNSGAVDGDGESGMHGTGR
jgi:hypothetical protein